MRVTWLTIFVDLPESVHAAAVDFWEAASATTRSAERGDDGQFMTLEPETGTAHLRVQRLDLPEPRVHLDVHVDDIGAAVRQASSLGARTISHDGHAVMASPGGFIFCFVDGSGDHDRPPALMHPALHQVDQICIDVPSDAFDAEVDFWTSLTGWEQGPKVLPEFSSLVPPGDVPIRVILQALGADDERHDTHAHLDISCGQEIAAVSAHHVSLGATMVEAHTYWTIMRDPVGMAYCLTSREPPSDRTG